MLGDPSDEGFAMEAGDEGGVIESAERLPQSEDESLPRYLYEGTFSIMPNIVIGRSVLTSRSDIMIDTNDIMSLKIKDDDTGLELAHIFLDRGTPVTVDRTFFFVSSKKIESVALELFEDDFFFDDVFLIENSGIQKVGDMEIRIYQNAGRTSNNSCVDNAMGKIMRKLRDFARFNETVARLVSTCTAFEMKLKGREL